MRLPFFSSSGGKKSPSLSRSDRSSSSDSDTPATPSSVLPRRRAFLGRNASCLDPEYCSAPPLLRPDPDGKIATADLHAALARLGSHHGAAKDLLEEADPDGHGRVSLEDLVGRGGEDDEEQLRVAFSVYDENGDGKISPEELHKVLRILGDGSCSLADCRRMIGGVDSDGDGFVCFRDFARMMSAVGGR